VWRDIRRRKEHLQRKIKSCDEKLLNRPRNLLANSVDPRCSIEISPCVCQGFHLESIRGIDRDAIPNLEVDGPRHMGRVRPHSTALGRATGAAGRPRHRGGLLRATVAFHALCLRHTLWKTDSAIKIVFKFTSPTQKSIGFKRFHFTESFSGANRGLLYASIANRFLKLYTVGGFII